MTAISESTRGATISYHLPLYRGPLEISCGLVELVACEDNYGRISWGVQLRVEERFEISHEGNFRRLELPEIKTLTFTHRSQQAARVEGEPVAVIHTPWHCSRGPIVLEEIDRSLVPGPQPTIRSGDL